MLLIQDSTFHKFQRVNRKHWKSLDHVSSIPTGNCSDFHGRNRPILLDLDILTQLSTHEQNTYVLTETPTRNIEQHIIIRHLMVEVIFVVQ
jgi:hypothetical protein